MNDIATTVFLKGSNIARQLYRIPINADSHFRHGTKENPETPLPVLFLENIAFHACLFGDCLARACLKCYQLSNMRESFEDCRQLSRTTDEKAYEKVYDFLSWEPRFFTILTIEGVL